MVELPIACTLSDPELRERERTILAALGAHVRNVAARPDGYVLELATTDEAIGAAMLLIQVERHCCPFLRFDLSVEPGEGPVRLALTGPTGTREFLATWLEPATGRTQGTG
jgi:hypothetical protein